MCSYYLYFLILLSAYFLCVLILQAKAKKLKRQSAGKAGPKGAKVVAPSGSKEDILKPREVTAPESSSIPPE
jgi:hypothetical protein